MIKSIKTYLESLGIKSIKTYLEGLGMPSDGTIDKMKFEQGILTIYYSDFCRIVIDKNNPSMDGVISNDEGLRWRTRDLRFILNMFDSMVVIWPTEDMRFALNILDSREEILEMIDNNVEFFEIDFWYCTLHIKRYGKEEEVIKGGILED